MSNHRTRPNVWWSCSLNVWSWTRWWVLSYNVQIFWIQCSIKMTERLDDSDNKNFMLSFDETIQPSQLGKLLFNLERLQTNLGSWILQRGIKLTSFLWMKSINAQIKIPYRHIFDIVLTCFEMILEEPFWSFLWKPEVLSSLSFFSSGIRQFRLDNSNLPIVEQTKGRSRYILKSIYRLVYLTYSLMQICF